MNSFIPLDMSGKSRWTKQGATNVILVVGVILTLLVGYFIGGIGKVSESDYKTLDQQYRIAQQEITQLRADLAQYSKKLKVAFVYVGPIGDYGWTYAHDVGRKYAERLFPWLQTTYVEKVSATDAPSVIDGLINKENVDVVFTTSFDFMDQTVEAARKYPNKLFFHCSGYKREKNLGTYFADFYPVYYLNGLMAGALTKSNKIGYVGAYPIPEVLRHINAFALGVKTVNPDARVYVRWIFNWYDPDSARKAAQALVNEGVDTLAFTEDSPAIIQFAQEKYREGKQIYVFSHYSPMYDYGPDVVVSGQLANWGVIYADILMKVKEGIYNNTNLANVDYLWLLKEGAVELGCKFGMPINPKFEGVLKAKTIDDPVLGRISVYDLVFIRLDQMSQENMPFDPFTGPIKSQNGTVMIQAGARGTIVDLFTDKMSYFIDNIIGSPKG